MAETDDNKLSTTVTDDFLLEDIEDLPSFVTPPTGAYIIRLEKGIEEQEIKGNDYYSVQLTIMEAVEINEKELDEGEQLPKQGDVASLLFKRDNKFGMGNFKDFVRSLAEKFECKTIGEIREHAKGVEMLVLLRRTYNKESKMYNISVRRAQLT